jgi:hypothetical protein
MNESKFKIGDRVIYNTGTYRGVVQFRHGEIMFLNTPTSQLLARAKVKWDGGLRTWVRLSVLEHEKNLYDRTTTRIGDPEQE